jgi:hypothetical protein
MYRRTDAAHRRLPHTDELRCMCSPLGVAHEQPADDAPHGREPRERLAAHLAAVCLRGRDLGPRDLGAQHTAYPRAAPRVRTHGLVERQATTREREEHNAKRPRVRLAPVVRALAARADNIALAGASAARARADARDAMASTVGRRAR